MVLLRPPGCPNDHAACQTCWARWGEERGLGDVSLAFSWVLGEQGGRENAINIGTLIP